MGYCTHKRLTQKLQHTQAPHPPVQRQHAQRQDVGRRHVRAPGELLLHQQLGVAHQRTHVRLAAAVHEALALGRSGAVAADLLEKHVAVLLAGPRLFAVELQQELLQRGGGRVPAGQRDLLLRPPQEPLVSLQGTAGRRHGSAPPDGQEKRRRARSRRVDVQLSLGQPTPGQLLRRDVSGDDVDAGDWLLRAGGVAEQLDLQLVHHRAAPPAGVGDRVG